MRRWAKITSFLVGVVAALTLLGGWQVPRGQAMLGADVRVSVVRSATLGLSQTGTVLDETHFRPGDTATVAITLRNPRARPVRVRVRSETPTDRVLGRLLRADVRAGSTAIFHGRLAALAQNTARPLSLAAAGSARVTVQVTLPKRADDAYAARSTQAALLFEELP